MDQVLEGIIFPGLHAHFGATAVKNMRTTIETPTADDAVLPEFLISRAAAGMLRMSERSFKRCRAEGSSPVHYMFGDRIVYALADLAEWAAASGVWARLDRVRDGPGRQLGRFR